MWALLVILRLSKPKLLTSEVIGGQSTNIDSLFIEPNLFKVCIHEHLTPLSHNKLWLLTSRVIYIFNLDLSYFWNLIESSINSNSPLLWPNCRPCFKMYCQIIIMIMIYLYSCIWYIDIHVYVKYSWGYCFIIINSVSWLSFRKTFFYFSPIFTLTYE